MSQRFFSGIEGLTGREPIGGVLRIGRTTGPRKPPIERDRFYICEPHQNDQGIRPLHPAFKKFNEADPTLRRVIRGNIYHADVADAFLNELSAYRLPGWKGPPTGGPTCRGDGKAAVRWHADENSDEGGHWREIKCPHDLCEFRQPDAKKNRACKPYARLYFQIRFRDETWGPAMLLKFEHKSWNDSEFMAGFFNRIEKIATEKPPKGLGLSGWSAFGLPFILTLSEKTNPRKGFRYPVVTMAADGSPIEFFAMQRKMLEAAGSVPHLVGARSDEENAPKVIEASHVELSAGIPGQGSLLE